MPRWTPFAVLAVLALVLAGCAAKDEPTTAVTAYPTHAVDAAGTAITLTEAPTRIVSADPGATAILTDLGLGDITESATVANVSVKAAASPTSLVVVPLTLDAAALAQLQAATPAPVFRYGADPLLDAPTTVAQLGLAVGRGPEAAAVAAALSRGLTALQERLTSEPPVSALIEGAGFTAYGPATPVGRDVAAAGGENVIAADQPLNLAEIAPLAPVAWISLAPGGSSLTELRALPELATVPAVRESRVLIIPRDGFPIDGALPGALRTLADDLRSAPVTTG